MKIIMQKTGAIWPFEIPVSHSWVAIGAIFATIQEYKIKTFIELGVEHGGLMSLLVMRARLSSKFNYVGIDNRNIIYPELAKFSGETLGSQFFIGDVFSEHIIGHVRNSLEMVDGAAMIYCDNGDKAKELETYAPLLVSGDLIAAHDFGHEFHLEDIEHIPDIERIEDEWLENTGIILFRKR